MATIYKCDKCGKIIKDANKRLRIQIFDLGHFLDEDVFNILELCESCAKPFAKNFNRFFKKPKITKK